MGKYEKCEECGKQFSGTQENIGREYIDGRDVCSTCADVIAKDLNIPDDERGK